MAFGSECFKLCNGVYAWGYGEDTLNHGLDVCQRPSLCLQTAGNRRVVMFPIDGLVSYLRSCNQGQDVSYAQVMDFIQQAQPNQMAAYLKMNPDGVCHGLLMQGSLAYVPPGWVLAEKA